MSFSNLWSWATRGPSRLAAPRTKNAKRTAARFTPVLSRLEDRTVLNGFVAAGAGPGAPPLVAIRVDKVFEPSNLNTTPLPGAGQQNAPQSDGKTDLTSQIFY